MAGGRSMLNELLVGDHDQREQSSESQFVSVVILLPSPVPLLFTMGHIQSLTKTAERTADRGIYVRSL